MGWKKILIGIAGCCLATVESHGQEVLPEPPSRQSLGIVSAEINEASGLVRSARLPNYFWTHNDSGDQARLFLIDSTAAHRATYYLEGVSAHDWEEIAWIERRGRHYLLVGDIGDNKGNRGHVQIHVVEEQVPDLSIVPYVDTIPTTGIQSFQLKYEDGPRDAEAMFYDPVDGLLFIISKRELEVGVYQTILPDYPADTLILRKTGNLPHTFITGADIHKNGCEILVKNLLEVFYWERQPDESISDLLKRPSIRLPYKPEPQGESIAFNRDSPGYFTLSEAVLGVPAVLYFYPGINPATRD